MNGKKLIKLGGSLLVLLGVVSGTPCAQKTAAPLFEEVKRAETVTPTASTDAQLLTDADDKTQFEVRNITRTPTDITYQFFFSFYMDDGDPEYSYMFGYYGEGDNYRPLTATYDVIVDGQNEQRTIVIANNSLINPYIGYGVELGYDKLTLYVHLDVVASETLDTDSIKLNNIFRAEQQADFQYLPDYSYEYYVSVVNMELPVVQNSDDFFTMSFSRFNTLNDYTSIIFNLNVDAYDKYSELKKSYINKHASKLKSGEYEIRYRLTSLTNTSFLVTYNDGTTQNISIRGTSMASFHPGDNEVNFMFSGLDTNNVKKIQIKELSFYMDIADATTKKTSAGSGITFLFGDFTFDTSAAPTTNVNMLILIASVIFFAVYLGVSTGLYIYRKNKYKNDEFRRMNTKKFVKQTGTFLLGIGSLYYFILFIVFRVGVMNNTLRVYNPCDIPITIFGVLSIIMVGYFTKYFITMYKAHKSKVNAEKLKLNVVGQKDDDGTN